MNRLPRYFRISVTDRCDLACVYCRPRGERPRGRAHTLTCREVVRFVRTAAACGVEKIRLTGGEPLLHEDILDMVRGLRSVPGIRSLGLTTNGQHLASLARPLREAGLSSVNISLPSLRPDVYRRVTGGRLREVLAGVGAALREGFAPVKLNVVVLRDVNDGEVEALGRLARGQPVEVRFIECMPFCEAPDSPVPFVSADEILEKLRALGRLRPEPGGASASAIRFSIPGFRGRVALIAPVTRPFCTGCRRLRLTAGGMVRACLVDGGEVDARPILRNGAGVVAMRRLLARAMELKPSRHHARFPGVMTRIGG